MFIHYALMVVAKFLALIFDIYMCVVDCVSGDRVQDFLASANVVEECLVNRAPGISTMLGTSLPSGI